ncbi:MAG: hypothetical protein JXA18_06670 [Chitinispirillaceae bacterium]|nr:hypothetical protein [Chitinispirillaceae bacterium]
MKTCTLSLFLVLVACTSPLDTASGDPPAVGVKVYACKPSDGDCYRIISENHLAGISCDTVKAKYPVYIVALGNVQSRTDMAYAPDIFIGETEIREWGSSNSKIIFKIYRDSVLESFAGKTVVIYPPYYTPSQGPVQKGVFPDSATVDSLVSAAKNGTDALPTRSEVRGESVRLDNYSAFKEKAGCFFHENALHCDLRTEAVLCLAVVM